MGEPNGERLLRAETSWRRASFLELFFDLVFVFALNRVSLRLINDYGGPQLRVSEAASTLLLFLALWLLWLWTVALTSRLHPDSPQGQVIVFIPTAGALVMAVTVAQGFEGGALIFAGAFVAARLARALLLLAFRLTQAVPIPLMLTPLQRPPAAPRPTPTPTQRHRHAASTGRRFDRRKGAPPENPQRADQRILPGGVALTDFPSGTGPDRTGQPAPRRSRHRPDHRDAHPCGTTIRKDR
jgi:hypothetical protein